MRQQIIALPSSYERRYNMYDGSWVVTRYNTTGGNAMHHERSDRDESPRPKSGWLYPKPYYVDIFSRKASSNGRIEVDATKSAGYIPGQGYVMYERRYVYEGNFGNKVHGGSGATLLPESDNDRNKAVVDALLQLKQQKVNLSVAFLEAKQTADFVGNSFKCLARSIELARRGEWKRSIKELRRRINRKYQKSVRTDNPGLTGDWLAWQYAAKPLMQDVDGAINELRSRNVLPYWITTVKGVSVHKETSERISNPGTIYSCEQVTEKFRGYFIRLDYHPGNTFLQSLSRVGVTNPLVSIWEKVPWSFVFDWAVSVGDYLNTLDAAVGWEFLSGSQTIRRETTERYVGTRHPLADTTMKWVFNDHSAVVHRLRLDRTIFTSSPLPSFPVVKNPLSSTHLANGLSLLVGALTGGNKPFVRT